MKPFDASAVTLGTLVIVKQFQGAVTPGRYLAKMEDGRHVVEMVAVNGAHFVNVFDAEDIFMPPTKRTVFVNFWMDNGLKCTPFNSEAEAKNTRGYHPWTQVATPVEIEE